MQNSWLASKHMFLYWGLVTYFGAVSKRWGGGFTYDNNCQYSFEIQNIWSDLIIEKFCFEIYVELSSYKDEVLYQNLRASI